MSSGPGTTLTMAVIVPTYRRPECLVRCLEALAVQLRRADEILVVIRDTDDETRDALQRAPAVQGVRTITVTEPGVVVALNAGLAAVDQDVVVITDDDAAPRLDWLARIERHYLDDPRVGGVGGRDCVPGCAEAASRHLVGRVQWWGRLVGNHHVGAGLARDVDVLKGVNMSFRRSALGSHRFDHRLRGSGAQVHNEVGFCLHLRRLGWRLIYDPEIVVDHEWGPRFDEEDQRDGFHAAAVRHAVHNETLSMLEHLTGLRRAVFLGWAFAVGTSAAPGAVQWVRFLLTGRKAAGARLLAGWQGRMDGLRTWRTSR
jgi:glycosyltransferase involved in cell wall biosynthesis